MFKKEIRKPILALFFLSLGGLMLHLRIHPVGEHARNLVPLLFGLATTFALPLLFNYRRTVAWAYAINIAAVIVGAVTMAWFSWVTWDISKAPVTVTNILLRSTLADILILAAKLPLGQMILRHFRPIDGQGEGRS